MPDYKHLAIETGPVYRVTINRPHVRNAFNQELISELTTAFSLEQTVSARVIVLGGVGDYFSAGADLNWMKEQGSQGPAENLSDARLLAKLFVTIHECDVPIVCQVQGGAFGGALGLIACSDVVVCADDCKFAFSEVRLGIAPATISPFVVLKTGAAFAREVMLSGKAFNAKQAYEAGLVSLCVPPEELAGAVQAEINQLLKAAPGAVSATKRILREAASKITRGQMDELARLIADLRQGEEGQEGLGAFLDKRKPGWIDKLD